MYDDFKLKKNFSLYGSLKNNLELYLYYFPANTTPWTNAGLMLAHRLRRWTNIKPALVQGVSCFV